MDALLQDLRYAVRTLRRSPGFALAALLSLALGLGANTAIFSAVDAALLRPLPYPEDSRLVSVSSTMKARGLDSIPLSLPDYHSYRDGAPSLAGLAAWAGASPNLTAPDAAPEQLEAAVTTANLPQVLGVGPRLGRAFSPEEETPGKDHVVLVSDAFFRRRLGGRADALGRASLQLDGESFTVVGVMPPGFDYPSKDTQLWLPLSLDAASLGRANHFIRAVGRLAPGASLERAQAELDGVAARLARDFKESALTGASVRPLRSLRGEDVRTELWVLLGAVGCVLLIACANLANLLLARGAARSRELAVRAALGAPRSRVVRQLLTESALLSLAGAVLGALVATWALDGVRALAPADLPGIAEASVDGRVLLFTFALALTTALLFGLAPALAVSRPQLSETLKAGGRGLAGGGRHRLRSGLVVAEVALAIVLLSGAGLLLRSFHALHRVDLGFVPAHVLTADIVVPEGGYKEPAQVQAFRQQLLQRLSGLPGVQAVGALSGAPLSTHNNLRLCTVEGASLPTDLSQVPAVMYRGVEGGALEAVGMQLVRGRPFGAGDVAGAPGVVLLNETAARRLFPGRDAVGGRLWLGPPESLAPPDVLARLPGGRFPRLTVVGVLKDAHTQGPGEEVPLEVYVPMAQALDAFRAMTLTVRTQGEPGAALAGVRGALAELDPSLPLASVTTLEASLDESLAPARLQTFLLGGFSLLALALALVGIYGVMAYAVSQRTQEFGVRMALGADGASVRRMVLREGARLVGLGLLLGLAGSLALARVLQGLLFGVGAGDPLTYAAVVVVLGGAALVALDAPARRATRVDPMESLRAD
ncbi:ABC transporter permease [Aggregicoccus sp. 17bor-14]|uniref:ABC transporter permease n=1 Tax=Myxococcaceae TaxID=31 RepID=UPI00129C5D96|nr:MULTISPECIES: ABC transporter permease [Myxococcaceae]MBF5045666.1 ABC transporter permease [Simulacricoccus sp. 17bor-14]MRI91403.1 ABC transporter permease [Aggregicoccus sp. 17bor-14]